MPDTEQRVTMHSDGFREAHPAVDVKIRAIRPDFERLLPLDLGSVTEPGETEARQIITPPEFTLDWADEHVDEAVLSARWEHACEDGFEQAVALAHETFGEDVKVYAEGRMGGWLVVHGLGDVEDWTPEQVERWVEFERQVEAIRDDVPRSYLWNVYVNDFEVEREAAEAEAEREAAEAAVGGVHTWHVSGDTLDRIEQALSNAYGDSYGAQAAEFEAVLDIVKAVREAP